ncbi:YaaC family protein [Methylophilus sp. TWE2]|uniref:YaaC family protein n=1 Tax=Methylophilus sp. TWE2 TaxID=1662285 RepID=UPI0006712B32|nr:YaaC family protein [Methylophilus sp. TWE2]AKR42083.1 hypothetical protein ACJ67_00520 [Methylophilus sp. TWE2]
MTPLKIHHIGSFQDEKYLLTSEEPLEEVWNHIGRFGTSFIARNFEPEKKNISWDEHIAYAKVRVRQALEFRSAAKSGSLLTAPLPLYYSFLNLTRAMMALGPEVIPKSAHGLKFLAGEELLSSCVQLTKGTFTDYLDAQGISWTNESQISLSDALGFIIEMAYDYQLFDVTRGHVQAISVRAIVNGPIQLHLLNYPNEFATDWQKDFPELAQICTAEETNVLLIKEEHRPNDYSAIAKLLESVLFPGLTLQNHATWYGFRKSKHTSRLTRASYYYVAIFILGSIVRYQPELLLAATTADSEIGWLLQRFIKLAERFFPQLKLMEAYKSQVYFSGSGGSF